MKSNEYFIKYTETVGVPKNLKNSTGSTGGSAGGLAQQVHRTTVKTAPTAETAIQIVRDRSQFSITIDDIRKI